MTESAADVSSQRGNISNSNEAIQVMQINAQHAKQAQIYINNWIDRQNQKKYIVLVQEPYVFKKKAAMQPRTHKNTQAATITHLGPAFTLTPTCRYGTLTTYQTGMLLSYLVK